MKKILFVLIVVLSSSGLYAQSNAVSKHFSQFQRDTSFTKISVTSRMFSLFADIDAEDPDQAELLEAMSKLKGIKGLVKEDNGSSRDMYFDAVDKIAADGSYEELMTIEDAQENVQFMIREEGDIIQELMMIVGGNRQFVVMTLYGEIDLNSIAKLSKVMGIKGLEKFSRIGEGDKQDKK